MNKFMYFFVLCVLSCLVVVVVVQHMPIAATFKVNKTVCVTGRPCMYPDVVDFRVIVITFNRPDSMLILLRSLSTLVLDGFVVALEIWIDRDKKNHVDRRTFNIASAFRWNGVLTRVHVQVIKLLKLFCKLYFVLMLAYRGVCKGGVKTPSSDEV